MKAAATAATGSQQLVASRFADAGSNNYFNYASNDVTQEVQTRKPPTALVAASVV